MLALQDRDGENTIVNEYAWGLNLGGGPSTSLRTGIGGLLNLAQHGQNYAYLYDGKGNVEAVLDPAQAAVSAYRYDPFGRLLAQSGSLTQPFGFSTKRYSAQVGMLHYQYRNYLPEIGHWTTRDPLGEAGGINLYAFVGNNPVNWVDPNGEVLSWATTATGAGFGLLGGVFYGTGGQVVSLARGQGFDWKAVGRAGAGGMVAGGIAGTMVGLAGGDPSAFIIEESLIATGIVSAGGFFGGMTEAALAPWPSPDYSPPYFWGYVPVSGDPLDEFKPNYKNWREFRDPLILEFPLPEGEMCNISVP